MKNFRETHRGRWHVLINQRTVSIHDNKVDGLLSATEYIKKGIKSDVKFFWNHDIFSEFDKSLLGKISLQNLYKERAQMLRDKYDYLILYYSGGSDSNNVLKTFLDNNIKLDCVYVKWPFKIIGKGIYTPNTIDRTAKNFLSEWDYALKPDLEYLQKNHPEIKIELVDWLDYADDDSLISDDRFATQNHRHSAVNLLRMAAFSPYEKKLRDKGKKVAAIWGIDKPQIGIRNNQVGMYFRDDLIHSCRAIDGFDPHLEFFYWTPDMPLLTYEMAYQTFLYFDQNSHLRSLIDLDASKFKEKNQIQMEYAVFEHITRQVCYAKWDFTKFQAGKPTHAYIRDKDWFFYDTGNYEYIVKKWEYLYSSYLKSIDIKFLETGINQEPTGYKPIRSPFYFLGEFTS